MSIPFDARRRSVNELKAAFLNQGHNSNLPLV